MSKRITIMLDDDLSVILHKIQAKRIAGENTAVSFSKVINDELGKHFRK